MYKVLYFSPHSFANLVLGESIISHHIFVQNFIDLEIISKFLLLVLRNCISEHIAIVVIELWVVTVDEELIEIHTDRFKIVFNHPKFVPRLSIPILSLCRVKIDAFIFVVVDNIHVIADSFNNFVFFHSASFEIVSRLYHI